MALVHAGCGPGSADPPVDQDEPTPTTPATPSDTATPVDTSDPSGTTPDTGDDGFEVALLPLVVAPYGDPADLFHPVVDAGTERFPTVVFIQGADVERTHYREVASRLSAFGYLVIVPDHERTVAIISGLYPEVDLIDAALEAVRAEGERTGSAIAGHVDADRSAVAGHSLGGVVALEAIAGECSSLLCTSGSYTPPASLRAGVTYGTNRKPPGFGNIPDTDNGGTPLLLIQGSADGAVNPDDTLETWERVVSPPKSLILLDGANHYSVTNTQNPPGAIPDSSPATLDQDTGLTRISTWMGRYLDAYVKEKPEALAWFAEGVTEPEPGVLLTTEGGP